MIFRSGMVKDTAQQMSHKLVSLINLAWDKFVHSAVFFSSNLPKFYNVYNDRARYVNRDVFWLCVSFANVYFVDNTLVFLKGRAPSKTWQEEGEKI